MVLISLHGIGSFCNGGTIARQKYRCCKCNKCSVFPVFGFAWNYYIRIVFVKKRVMLLVFKSSKLQTPRVISIRYYGRWVYVVLSGAVYCIPTAVGFGAVWPRPIWRQELKYNYLREIITLNLNNGKVAVIWVLVTVNYAIRHRYISEQYDVRTQLNYGIEMECWNSKQEEMMMGIGRDTYNYEIIRSRACGIQLQPFEHAQSVIEIKFTCVGRNRKFRIADRIVGYGWKIWSWKFSHETVSANARADKEYGIGARN